MNLKEIINSLPEEIGCYIFKNQINNIIYIGKSKNLKNRVKQYFYKNVGDREKIYALRREIKKIEYIITNSETDALILECYLIKKYKPFYNSMLKKNKLLPYIAIDKSLDYPSIFITTETQMKSTMVYLDCFYSERETEKVMELISDIWKAPNCNKKNYKNVKKCLRYDIKKCVAPCEYFISREEYLKIINNIINFFENQEDNSLILELERKLIKEIENLEFEKAQITNENINNINYIIERKKRIITNLQNKEVFLFFRAPNEKEISLFYIYNEKVLSRITFLKEESNSKIIEFLNNIKRGKNYLDLKNIKSNYLTEIVADKYFINTTDLDDFEKEKKIFESFENYIKNDLI